jgi:hypothetical protein
MMDADELALLADTARKAIAGATTGGRGAVDAVLAEIGWLELLRAEPRAAVDVVFGALGATGGAATVLDDAVASALGVEPRAALAVLLPPFAAWHPPGRTDGGRVRASGLATARAATAGELLVVYSAGAELWGVTVPIAGVDASLVGGIDPDAGFHSVRVEGAAAGATPLDAAAWESAVAFGRRAVAHQIAGASRAMLGLACAHAMERVQFGRPIARFQAVRHRLADALVAVEALEASLPAAGDEPNADTAALAKAMAGRTARTVAAHCQQVLAGIGFTTDHPFHRFLKRTMALEGLFGSADDIVVDLGRQLLAARRVPTLIEL